MSKWVNRLDLRDLWEKHNREELTTEQVAKETAKRIRKMPCYKKYKDELEYLIIDFEICGNDVEEFDSILARLYDWADISLPTPRGEMQRKMCWVATF